MNGIDRAGRKVSVDRSAGKKRRGAGLLSGLSVREMRGFLARAMIADGVHPEVGAKVLKVSRSTFYDAMATKPGTSSTR